MKLKMQHGERVLPSWTHLGVPVALCLVFTISCSRQSQDQPEPVAANPPPAATQTRQPEIQPSAPMPASPSPEPAAVPSPATSAAIPALPSPRPEPSPWTRQLVASLGQIDLTHGPLTPEQATAWKQNLKQLTDQGSAAIPAIREFLEKNTDLNLDAAGSGQLVGWSSLRLAMMDTLQNIGGPEATATLVQTLQTTADPTELATLANLLEKSDPEKYRAAVLTAAKESLALAASGQWDGREVSPLFEILKQYGGATAATDLERYANTWFNYTPLTLAQMPDGAGIPSLIRLAQNADGTVTLGRDIYQRILAQSATQYPTAADALVEQARANRVEVSAWPGVADALAGNTLLLAKPVFDPPVSQPDTRSYHVSVGNQNYVEVPPSPAMTAKQINGRIQLIDTLLGTTSNPAAIDALKGARNSLTARLAAAK